MHGVCVLHLFSISFLTQDRQNSLLSASIFVEPGWPKRGDSITCFLSSMGIIFYHSQKLNRSVLYDHLKPKKILFDCFANAASIVTASDLPISCDLEFRNQREGAFDLFKVFRGFDILYHWFFCHMIFFNVVYCRPCYIVVFQFHDGKVCRWQKHLTFFGTWRIFGFLSIPLRACACSLAPGSLGLKHP